MSNDRCVVHIVKGSGKKPEWYPIEQVVSVTNGKKLVYPAKRLPNDLYLFCGETREAKKSLLVRGAFGRPVDSEVGIGATVFQVALMLLGAIHLVTSIGHALAN